MASNNCHQLPVDDSNDDTSSKITAPTLSLEEARAGQSSASAAKNTTSPTTAAGTTRASNDADDDDFDLDYDSYDEDFDEDNEIIEDVVRDVANNNNNDDESTRHNSAAAAAEGSASAASTSAAASPLPAIPFEAELLQILNEVMGTTNSSGVVTTDGTVESLRHIVNTTYNQFHRETATAITTFRQQFSDIRRKFALLKRLREALLLELSGDGGSRLAAPSVSEAPATRRAPSVASVDVAVAAANTMAPTYVVRNVTGHAGAAGGAGVRDRGTGRGDGNRVRVGASGGIGGARGRNITTSRSRVYASVIREAMRLMSANLRGSATAAAPAVPGSGRRKRWGKRTSVRRRGTDGGYNGGRSSGY